MARGADGEDMKEKLAVKLRGQETCALKTNQAELCGAEQSQETAVLQS